MSWPIRRHSNGWRWWWTPWTYRFAHGGWVCLSVRWFWRFRRGLASARDDDQARRERAAERVMRMSDAEIVEDYRARGLDPEVEAERVRQLIQRASERNRTSYGG